MLRAAAKELVSTEDVTAVFPFFEEWRLFDGLLVVTTERLFYIKAGYLRRHPRIHSFQLGDIERAVLALDRDTKTPTLDVFGRDARVMKLRAVRRYYSVLPSVVSTLTHALGERFLDERSTRAAAPIRRVDAG